VRAFEIQSFGLEGLKRTDRPEPVPGAGQVRLRVRAASLNYRDLLMVEGRYDPRLRLPLVPLSDAAGEIDAVGSEVDGLRVGDRVATLLNQRWDAGEPTREKVRPALGGPLDGVLAEQVVLPERGVVPIPSHLTDEEAATLPCAGLTGWNAVVGHGGTRPGDTVLVLGTGGVALFALQFARLLGARVIVTSSSDGKLARARELGAWRTLNYAADPDWDARVHELTGGRGADVVVEVGGARTLPRSLRSVRLGGRVCLIGVLSGHAGELDLRPILMKQVTVQGILVGSRESFEQMNRAVEAAGLHPVVDRVFDFEAAPEAFRYLAEGQHFGKICVRV